MSFLPYRSADGSRYADDVPGSKIPRCPRCHRVLDGEAEVNGEEHCTSCQGILRMTSRDEIAERQRRIEETLE